MFKSAHRTWLLLLLLWLNFTWMEAAPKSYTCMSFSEDDIAQQDDDDTDVGLSNEDFDEYAASAITAETLAESIKHVPFKRICQEDYTFCFALWRQTPNGTHIEKQGCWKESTERNATCSQTECTSSAPTSRNNSLYYCCCSGDICNTNVLVVDPAPLQLSKPIYSESTNYINAHNQVETIWSTILSWCSLIVASVLFSIVSAFFYCRTIKDKPIPEEAPLAPSGPGYSSNLRNVDNINLICMLGNGKYGTVMKGLLHDQEVAVKIFPEAHHQYYINERSIYSLPLMDSPSLLTYFGYDEHHTMEGKLEYQLVLSLAELGCLFDWLTGNTLTFDIFCGMAKSITRGLSHLHTELRHGDELKPCIAHRDLNSRNVLVKADLTCCIADFGFALKVFGSKYEYKGEIAMAETKSINEVGTIRYMAPELLEGAVNLRDCETSLKQMDVYALGLVLWEIATRCSDFYAPAQQTPPYKAPYELEVGTHPTFDQMQTLVVRHKARPLFPAGWGGKMAAAKLVKDTCEDCWDHDAEARLTSLCAEERMQEASTLRPRRQPNASLSSSSSPLLSANNLNSNIITEVVSRADDNVDLSAANSSTTATAESTSMTVQRPPPNQTCRNSMENGNLSAEKNHLSYMQQQLQPYQGRNPCLERNLAPVVVRPPPVLVEKSKKHSFQTGQEHSFSCLEDDVSVEDLISNRTCKKFSNLSSVSGTLHDDASTSIMGQGFPKQQNTDKKLSGWHSVRALIQKKLFRKEIGLHGNSLNDDVVSAAILAYGDEKSNLVENRRPTTIIKGIENGSAISFIDAKDQSNINANIQLPNSQSNLLDTSKSLYIKRPNNLDLSPMSTVRRLPATTSTPSSRQTQDNNLNEIQNGVIETDVQPEETHFANTSNGFKHINGRVCTPAHLVPRSLSTSRIKQNNLNDNDNIKNNNINNVSQLTSTSQGSLIKAQPHEYHQSHFKRQHSLEVFREVFSGRGSTGKLRDPSQRVKTPGDVPPSVRKVRASKTLSLYDDRMMDGSAAAMVANGTAASLAAMNNIL